jgi:inner membrane transporter RhtA
MNRSTVTGAVTMLGSGTCNQVGAAFGAHAFPMIGPAGVVAIRQVVAAAVLLPVARPDPRKLTWPQWWPVLGLAVVFAVMNLSLYTAIDRIGLGLAVTLEVLGPLAVAVLGSRTRVDLICALAAAGGVYVLVLPGPTTDYAGVGLGVLAACCWAGYILLNRVAGQRVDGLQAPALATSLSALGYLPVLVLLVVRHRLGWAALGWSTGAGIGASVIPYAADLITLRRVPARFYGVFQSVTPVLAALAGLVFLGQALHAHQWAGMAMVIAANAVAVLSAARLTAPARPALDPLPVPR